MFFSSSPTIPFKTLRQGLALYPTWKFLTSSDYIIHVQPLAEEVGDPLFVRVWEEAQRPGQEIIQPDIESALRKLLQPGYFLYVAKSNLLSQYKQMTGMRGLELEILDHDSSPSSVILNKGSPLTKILNEGTTCITTLLVYICRQDYICISLVRKFQLWIFMEENWH